MNTLTVGALFAGGLVATYGVFGALLLLPLAPLAVVLVAASRREGL